MEHPKLCACFGAARFNPNVRVEVCRVQHGRSCARLHAVAKYPLPETFPCSASFGSTLDTGLCQSTEVSLGYGLCFATETGTHSANCATSCLGNDVGMPVVVLDRCPYRRAENCGAPQLVRSRRLCLATEVGTHSATAQSSAAMGGVFRTAERYFLGPCAQAHGQGGHVHRDMAPLIYWRARINSCVKSSVRTTTVTTPATHQHIT